MKKFPKIITILLLLFSFSTIALGQETDIKSEEQAKRGTTKYFDLELIRAPQTPFGKTVTYTLNIRPLMDSPKTEIIWNYPVSLNVL